MIICPVCHKPNPDGSSSCFGCGTIFQVPSYPQPSAAQQASSGSAVKGYLNIILDTLIHPNFVTVIFKPTGSIIARIPKSQWNDEMEARYTQPQYVVVG